MTILREQEQERDRDRAFQKGGFCRGSRGCRARFRPGAPSRGCGRPPRSARTGCSPRTRSEASRKAAAQYPATSETRSRDQQRRRATRERQGSAHQLGLPSPGCRLSRRCASRQAPGFFAVAEERVSPGPCRLVARSVARWKIACTSSAPVVRYRVAMPSCAALKRRARSTASARAANAWAIVFSAAATASKRRG